MIDGDAAFEALKNNDEWNHFYTDPTSDNHVELKGKTSDNTIVFKNIEQNYSVAGGRGSGKTSNNTLIIDNSIINAKWREGGYSYDSDANYNTIVINNIREITAIERKLVFTLLLICLVINIFNFFDLL